MPNDEPVQKPEPAAEQKPEPIKPISQPEIPERISGSLFISEVKNNDFSIEKKSNNQQSDK